MKNKIPKSIIHRLRGKNGSKTITIPANICKKYNYQAGDKFEISIINENTLQIKRILIL
jgi:antitoxin component of MazEF toxin-antitoxin module